MKTILFMIVIFLASLVFLTNFDNPWQEKVKTVLHSFEDKELMSNPDLSEFKEGKEEDIALSEKQLVTEKPFVYRVEVKEKSSEVSPSIKKEDVAPKQAASESFPEVKLNTARNLYNISKQEKAQEGTKEHFTAQEIKSLMKILDQTRRKLLGIEEAFPPRNGEGQNEQAYVKKGASSQNTKAIRKKLREVAIELGIEPSIALSMAEVESGCDPRAVSPKGAVGVLQVMPQVAQEHFGIDRDMLFDPEVNIRVGLSWMKALLNQFDQDLDLSLAAYNAGANRVIEAGHKVPPIRETQDYVKKVKKFMKNEV